MRRIAGGVVLGLALVAQPAGAMTVNEFLAKAVALRAKGMMALFSSDLGVLKRETKTAMEALRADRLAAEKAGRKPLYCPRPGAKTDSDEFLSALQAIPPAERGVSIRDGFARVLAKRFPC